MPEQQREKLQFPTNIPVTVQLGKNFKSGSGEYGNWHGWNVIQDGVEKVIFAKDALHDKIKDYGEGSKLTITYAEKRGADGKPFHEWQVVNGQPAKKPELTRESFQVDFNLESHLMACAELANKITAILGIKDDQARQATFATICIDAQRHNIILGASQAPEQSSAPKSDARKDALISGVRSACKLLNDEGYEPAFTPVSLKEYVNENFDVKNGVDDLTFEQTEELIQMMSEKLDNFRINKQIDLDSVVGDDETPF